MKTYEELCRMRIGDMNEEELKEFALGLLNEVWDYEKIINKVIEYINITIKIIKEQPSSCELNDIWILEHLNSFLEILGDKE